jgi:hypothetical protein
MVIMESGDTVRRVSKAASSDEIEDFSAKDQKTPHAALLAQAVLFYTNTQTKAKWRAGALLAPRKTQGRQGTQLA